MDSVGEETGPQEPTEVCLAKVRSAVITDFQKELAECPLVTEVQTNAAGGVPAGSEASTKDSATVSGGRIAAPKQGKKSECTQRCSHWSSWLVTVCLRVTHHLILLILFRQSFLFLFFLTLDLVLQELVDIR